MPCLCILRTAGVSLISLVYGSLLDVLLCWVGNGGGGGWLCMCVFCLGFCSFVFVYVFVLLIVK